MAIRIIVSMTAAVGKREELAAAFRTLCPSVQAEPGCQQYEFYQSVFTRAYGAHARSEPQPGCAAGRSSGRTVYRVSRARIEARV